MKATSEHLRWAVVACFLVVACAGSAASQDMPPPASAPAFRLPAAEDVVLANSFEPDVVTSLVEPAPTTTSNVIHSPGGWEFRFFPPSLLWAPPLASKREPRFLVMPSSLNNYTNNYSLDTSIGNTLGILRVSPVASDWDFQLDLFAVVHSRLSPEDLMATDYRMGLPFTFRYGDWHGKIAYEHTSAHLGDEVTLHTGRRMAPYANDEVVFAIDRVFWNSVRPYFQVGLAYLHDLPREAVSRLRYDCGVEWFDRTNTSVQGMPFAAVHCELRGETDFNANWNFQSGWRWQYPEQRLATCRLFLEYYTGRSPYGQFYQERESFTGFAMAFDY